MKAFTLAFLAIAYFSLTSQAGNQDPAAISFTVRLGNQNFNKTNATGKFFVLSGEPKYESVLVKYSPQGDFIDVSKDELEHATWTSYDGIIRMNLGPKDGVYQIEFGLKGAGSDAPAWFGTLVTLTQQKPVVIITCPTNQTVAEPFLQLTGYSPTPLDQVKYDLSNAKTVMTNQLGFMTDIYLDTKAFRYTTNFFQCYDIRLAEGLNKIILYAYDKAGNETIKNLSVTLDYARANTPDIQVTWPKEGMEICGNSFTVIGQVQDSASTAMVTITDTNGHSATIHGIVERTGKLWVDNIPLRDGTNRLVLSVTNAAGLGCTTNLSVVRTSFVLTMDRVKESLWLPHVTVSGYESDGTYPVWVNGVKATVSINGDGSGKWVAQEVPVTEGGVATFDMNAYKPDEIQPDGLYGNGKPAPVDAIAQNSHTAQKRTAQDTTTPAVKPLQSIPVQPILINITESNAKIYFTWNAIPNQTYQLQYATDLISSNWDNLGLPIKAATNSISTTDTIERNGHRFYRIFLLP